MKWTARHINKASRKKCKWVLGCEVFAWGLSLRATISSHRKALFKKKKDFTRIFFFCRTKKILKSTLKYSGSSSCSFFHLCTYAKNTRAKPYEHSRARSVRNATWRHQTLGALDRRDFSGSTGERKNLKVPLVSQAVCSVTGSQQSFCTCCCQTPWYHQFQKASEYWSVLACFQQMHCKYTPLLWLLACEGLKENRGEKQAGQELDDSFL